jgi:hypothetical protein
MTRIERGKDVFGALWQFGPEYQRTVARSGDQRSAEADLAARQQVMRDRGYPVDDFEQRAADADVQGDERATDELRRQDLDADERSRGATVVEERPPDQEPATTPVDAAAAEATPDSRTAGTTAPSTTGPLLAAQDAEGFRARWTDVQAGLVDASRRAVEQVDALVAELMQHLASTFADERGRLERHWDRGDDVSDRRPPRRLPALPLVFRATPGDLTPNAISVGKPWLRGPLRWWHGKDDST